MKKLKRLKSRKERMLAEQDADSEGIEVPGIGRIQITEEASESVVQSDLPLVPGTKFLFYFFE